MVLALVAPDHCSQGWHSRDHEYAKLLESMSLWPVDPKIELNWSGRGQHVSFGSNELDVVNDILVFQKLLEHGASASVTSVKCRRVLLARKTMRCVRSLTKAEVLKEVSHLTQLPNAHVVRVIGTYTMGNELSILLYPVAEYNMDTFLAALVSATPDYHEWYKICMPVRRFYPCVSGAVQYMHFNRIKHMDIKPQNILIRKGKGRAAEYNVYMADFGIARSYAQDASIETDGRTSFTLKYAAPEVVRQEVRGMSADIFSLGCVFLEIYAAVSNVNLMCGGFRLEAPRDDHEQLRAEFEKDPNRHPSWQLQSILDSEPDNNASYQEHIVALKVYIEESSELRYNYAEERMVSLVPQRVISRMIAVDPSERPTSDELVKVFGKRLCCDAGPLPLESMDSILNEDYVEDF